MSTPPHTTATKPTPDEGANSLSGLEGVLSNWELHCNHRGQSPFSLTTKNEFWSSFLDKIINFSFDTQYSVGKPTFFQDLYSHAILSHKYLQSSCHCFLWFLLIGPLWVFRDRPEMIQKHIILAAHATFLNPTTPDVIPDVDFLPESTQYLAKLECDLVPIRAIFFTWLLAKSGLQTYFPDRPMDEAASNLFHHVFSTKQYRCGEMYAFDQLHDLNLTTFRQFGASNPTQFLPHPLFDRTNPVVNNLKSIVCDTKGNTLYFRRIDDNEAVFDGDEQQPLDQINRIPQWDGVTIMNLNNPFTNCTQFDLFNPLSHNPPLNINHAEIRKNTLEFVVVSQLDSCNTCMNHHDAEIIFETLSDDILDNFYRGEPLPFTVEQVMLKYDIKSHLRRELSNKPVLDKHFPPRFQNPSNQTEIDLILNQTNQVNLKSGEVTALTRQHKRYLKALAEVETAVVSNMLKSVLHHANHAKLLDIDNGPQSRVKSYPFPPPTDVNGKSYHKDLSDWCIEMLLVISLQFQPTLFPKHYHIDIDAGFPQPLLPQRTLTFATPQDNVLLKFKSFQSKHLDMVVKMTQLKEPQNDFYLHSWFLKDSLLTQTMSAVLKIHQEASGLL